jgi:transcriptional regulator with XRE-family HTH domain
MLGNIDGRSSIGERLKAARRQRDLTLAEMSHLTAVSVSTLSKIENSQVSPSFDVIMRISEGLDISLEDLVRSDAKTQVSGCKAITRQGDGVHMSTGQYEYKAHATELAQKHMVPLEMTILARSPEEFETWGHHPGEEYVYIVEGEIEVHTEAYAPFRLKTGESAYFDSGMRHVYICTSSTPARLISVSYDPKLGRRQIGGAQPVRATLRVD